MTLEQKLAKISERAEDAPDCGAHGCRFAAKKSGMRTNGGCRCLDRSVVHWNAVERYAALTVRDIPLLLGIVRELMEALEKLSSTAQCEYDSPKLTPYELGIVDARRAAATKASETLAKVEGMVRGL